MNLTGKGAEARLASACLAGHWVVTTTHFDGEGPCQMIDAAFLEKTGAMAIYVQEEGLQLIGAKDQAGERLWNMD